MLSRKHKLFICLLFASFAHAVDTKSTAPVTLPVPKPETKIEAISKPAKKVETTVPEIVVVDVQKIINETQVDREHVEGLFGKQQKFQKELKVKGEVIQKKEKDLKAKASTLSADALKKLYEELDDLRVQGNRLAERRQKELQEEEMKTRFNVFKTIQGYADDFIKQNPQIKIVVEKNSLLAFNKTIDKTDELIKIIKADMAKKEAAKKKKEAAKKTETAKKK